MNNWLIEGWKTEAHMRGKLPPLMIQSVQYVPDVGHALRDILARCTAVQVTMINEGGD